MSEEAIKVLIVDDLEVNRLMLAKGLERQGFLTAEAIDGTMALRVLETETFDIVLLDIVMPGMGGQDTLRLIRARFSESELPVIMVTAMDDPETVTHALNNGASDYLTKPVNINVTVSRINVHVGRRKAVQELHRSNISIKRQIRERTAELEAMNAELRAEITRRRELEAELREATSKAEQANRAKSDFLATMSHELRTPLNSIIGFSDLIALQVRQVADGERLGEYASYINDSGNHLLGIVNDILDLSKIDAGRTVLNESHTGLCDLISRSVRMIDTSDEGHQIIEDIDGAIVEHEVFCDEILIRRALVNLVSNAVKFSDPGSLINVHAAVLDGGDLSIEVIDQGMGIAPEDMARVLEPFGQASSELSRSHVGTGLGVPLTKSLIELHGGSFAIASVVGEGTTVTLTLPADRVKAVRNDDMAGRSAASAA